MNCRLSCFMKEVHCLLHLSIIILQSRILAAPTSLSLTWLLSRVVLQHWEGGSRQELQREPARLRLTCLRSHWACKVTTRTCGDRLGCRLSLYHQGIPRINRAIIQSC